MNLSAQASGDWGDLFLPCDSASPGQSECPRQARSALALLGRLARFACPELPVPCLCSLSTCLRLGLALTVPGAVSEQLRRGKKPDSQRLVVPRCKYPTGAHGTLPLCSHCSWGGVWAVAGRRLWPSRLSPRDAASEQKTDLGQLRKTFPDPNPK